MYPRNSNKKSETLLLTWAPRSADTFETGTVVKEPSSPSIQVEELDSANFPGEEDIMLITLCCTGVV